MRRLAPFPAPRGWSDRWSIEREPRAWSRSISSHLPDVDPKRIEEALGRVMPDPRLIALSARTGAGMGDWLAWLEKARAG